MSELSVVTGATGLLGSHLCEALVARGGRVRALVRPGADAGLLEKLGVEVARGDLSEPKGLAGVFSGAGVVYHCAARVSDWGPWRLFQETVIDTTRNVLEACRPGEVGRVVYVSSSRVYGHPRKGDPPLTEESPTEQRLWRLWDYYPRAKARAEELVRAYPGGWTIVRPTWIYGPRDRATLPRMIHTLELGQGGLIGGGHNPLNIVHAGDVADGMVRAGTSPAARGQVYNLSAEETFTQRQLFDALTEAMGRPPLTRRVPYALAFALGLTVELVGKALRVKRNLRITRHAVSLLASTARFSSAKAREQLGWSPRVRPLEGLREAVAWHFSQRPPGPAPAA
jgi:nucleoside-diphosphate-sugar epimerase